MQIALRSYTSTLVAFLSSLESETLPSLCAATHSVTQLSLISGETKLFNFPPKVMNFKMPASALPQVTSRFPLTSVCILTYESWI